MINNRGRTAGRNHRESGQALVFLVLALGLVFVAAGALSVDMSNLWFHRQAAQNAADAACTAGAMDLLVDAQGLATGHQGFVNGTGFNCTTTSTASPCKYAAMNGYNSNNTSPGNLVSVSFPSTVTGVPSAAIPPSGIAPNAFMRVDVTDNIQTYFSGLLSGSRNQTLRAFAVCGIVLAQSPTPLLVLAPTGQSISLSGTPNINIVGGPQRSIQLNSDAATAFSGASKIDLSLGGPNGTGSDFGVFGGPGANPGVNLGTTGHYFSPSAPIADPFAQIPAPAIPTNGPLGNSGVAKGFNVDGCPDTGGCQEFTPGYYPNGINVKNNTAIFQPGLYYVLTGFSMDANSCAYPSTAVGDGSGGTTFYFADTSSFICSCKRREEVSRLPQRYRLRVNSVWREVHRGLGLSHECTRAGERNRSVRTLPGPNGRHSVRSKLCHSTTAIRWGLPA